MYAVARRETVSPVEVLRPEAVEGVIAQEQGDEDARDHDVTQAEHREGLRTRLGIDGPRKEQLDRRIERLRHRHLQGRRIASIECELFSIVAPAQQPDAFPLAFQQSR